MLDESPSEKRPVAELAVDGPWTRLIDELARFRHLAADWDGQGAEAPCPDLLDGAIRLARRFQEDRQIPADRVTVGVNGTVYFSWHFPGEYREIEVVSPNEAEVRTVRDGSAEADESFLSW